MERATLHLTAAVLRALQEDPTASWEIAARIERHLRHHLYLYAPNGGRNQRSALWGALATAASKFSKSHWKALDERLRFDVLVGAIEIGPNGNSIKHKLLLNDFWSARLRLASEVWPTTAGLADELALKLLDIGWESLAAKVLGDELLELIRQANHKGAARGTVTAILEAAERV